MAFFKHASFKSEIILRISINHCRVKQLLDTNPEMMKSERLTEYIAKDHLIQNVDNFLFDCDGVLWNWPTIIPGLQFKNKYFSLFFAWCELNRAITMCEVLH
jgi:hypothetical protein